MTKSNLSFQEVTTKHYDVAHCKADGLVHVVIRVQGQKLFDLWVSDVEVSVTRRIDTAIEQNSSRNKCLCSGLTHASHAGTSTVGRCTLLPAL